MKKFIIFTIATLTTCLYWQTNAQVTEGFESGLPSTWSTIIIGDSADPGFMITTAEAHTGSQSVYHNDDDTTDGINSYLATDYYMIEDGVNNKLTFWYRQNFTTNYYSFSGVYLRLSPTDQILLQEFDAAYGYSEDTWSEYTYDLSAYEGQSVRIEFRYTGDFSHEFYIDDFSLSSANPECGDDFYDVGGPSGNYLDNQNATTVIAPGTSADAVTVTFSSFDVESNFDALYVYDGPNTSSPLIDSGNPGTTSGFPAGGYYGTTPPGPFTSTHPSGALTFVFRSDGSFTYSGWEAQVSCAPGPPDNDNVANAIAIPLGFPCTGDAWTNVNATAEPGEPTGSCFYNDTNENNSVWFGFTAPESGNVTVTTDIPPGNLDTQIAVYVAPTDPNDASTIGPEVGCDDDGGTGTLSTLELTGLIAGADYVVQVDGWGGGTDTFCIEVFETPPSNDDLANAIPLTMDGSCTGDAYLTGGATLQTDEPYGSCLSNSTGNTVWFSFTAPSTGNATVSTDISPGDIGDTQVTVYEAPSDVNDLSTLGAEVGCDDDSGTNGDLLSVVTMPGLTAGDVYYVQVNGKNDTSGSFCITVTENLGVEDQVIKNFSFYPNPAQNLLHLEANDEIQQVSFYDLLGRKVLEKQPKRLKTDLNLQQLKSGVYLMKVKIGGTLGTYKIMKE